LSILHKQKSKHCMNTRDLYTHSFQSTRFSPCIDVLHLCRSTFFLSQNHRLAIQICQLIFYLCCGESLLGNLRERTESQFSNECVWLFLCCTNYISSYLKREFVIHNLHGFHPNVDNVNTIPSRRAQNDEKPINISDGDMLNN